MLGFHAFKIPVGSDTVRALVSVSLSFQLLPAHQSGKGGPASGRPLVYVCSHTLHLVSPGSTAPSRAWEVWGWEPRFLSLWLAGL